MKHILCFFSLLIISIQFFLISGCASNAKASEIVIPQSDLDDNELAKKRFYVGQMVIIGLPGYELSDFDKKFFKKYKVGNVILFKWNVKDAAQIEKLTSEIQKEVVKNTGHPALIFMDQEGGRVSRISKDMTKLPPALSIAEFGSEKIAYEGGITTARQLSLVGVNADFAPVNDVFSNPKNKVIGDRAFGKDAGTVIKFSGQMMKGLLDGGVVACAKHFPGHGDTEVDSHHALPVVYKTYDELKEMELKPFKASIDSGIPMIMTAHILFPKIDDKFPATMSKKILTGILREDMGFEGVIVSDSMEMDAIKDNYGIANGAVGAINAGADMICLTKLEQYDVDVFEALLQEVGEERLAISCDRILKLKEKFIKSKNVISKKEFKKRLQKENQKIEAINLLVNSESNR